MAEHSFPVESRNRVRRVAKRGRYDHQSVYQVIDAALLAHVSVVDPEQGLVAIPMLHARRQNELLFHGATSSRLMQLLSSGQSVAVSFAMVDGLVLAKSLFHHSMNYRSVVAFGRGRELESEDERLEGLKTISDKVMPGRWDDARAPNEKEMKATSVIAVEIESASAKIRTGDPVDDVDDQALNIWSGVVPIETRLVQPVADQHSLDISIPEYINKAIANPGI